MGKSDTKASVFMVTNANIKNGVPDINSFVRSQADSILSVGWEVFMGVVDDRTSVPGILRNIRRLRQQVAQMKPGLVHVQYGSVTAAVGNFIKGTLPLVVSFCGDDLLGTPTPGLAWRIRERVGRFIGLLGARRADAIIVKSNNLFQSLPSPLRDKAIILPNGVDTNFFRPMERSEARAKLGWSQRSQIVLFNPSRKEDQDRKNPTLARRTVELLAQSVPDVSLQMLFNASPEEVRIMMNAADCLLVTSLHEGSPNIVKEAMSCNLPVVSVPCGDVAERLKMTQPGGIRPYTAGSLAKAIIDVFDSGCRSNGREQLLAQGLTTAEIAERLIQIYRHVQQENPHVTKEVSSKVCVE